MTDADRHRDDQADDLDPRDRLWLAVARRFPTVDLDAGNVRWSETEDGEPTVMVDGIVTFTLIGDDLYYTRPEPGSKVRTYRITRDGRYTLAGEGEDPWAARAAAAPTN